MPPKDVQESDGFTQEKENEPIHHTSHDEENPKGSVGVGDGDASPDAPSFSKLLSLGRPEMWALILSVFLMIAAEATALSNPLLLANAYNHLMDLSLTADDKMAAITGVMILVIVVHVVGMAAGYVRLAIMGAVGERVVARLRNDLYSSILSQDVFFFDGHKTGELVSRLGSDTTLIQVATSSALPEVIIGAVKVVVCIVLMFWISPSLAGLTLGMTFVIGSLSMPFGKKIGDLSKVYQDVLGTAQERSTEALGSVRTVQSFAAEGKEKDRYMDAIGDPGKYPYWIPPRKELLKTTYGAGLLKSIWNSGFFTFIFGAGFGSMYLSLWYGFRLVVEGQITLGELTAFQSYIFQIGMGLGQTGRFITQVLEAKGASGRIFQLLERVPAIPSPPVPGKPIVKPIVPDSMEGTVELRDVTFEYPSRPGVPVLNDFSLIIRPNTTVALIGSSGAGKSTIVSLLQRFYDINQGSIMIDGVDVRDLDLQWLRSQIGYVQQEPSLFGLSVRDNVVYGVNRDVPQEEVERACISANAHDFIVNKLGDGYDTLVGERGVKLSGGQKQRLAIARALLVNPRILLLDEATSALDAESEHLVQEAIDKAVVGRTVIVIAHR